MCWLPLSPLGWDPTERLHKDGCTHDTVQVVNIWVVTPYRHAAGCRHEGMWQPPTGSSCVTKPSPPKNTTRIVTAVKTQNLARFALKSWMTMDYSRMTTESMCIYRKRWTQLSLPSWNCMTRRQALQFFPDTSQVSLQKKKQLTHIIPELQTSVRWWVFLKPLLDRRQLKHKRFSSIPDLFIDSYLCIFLMIM